MAKPTPELQNALVELLKEVTETVDQSKEFIIDQTPLVIKELILWKRISLPIELVIYVSLSILGIYLLLKGCKDLVNSLKLEDQTDKECTVLINKGLLKVVPGIIIALGCTINACYVLTRTLEVWIAPRVFVLEYIRRML